MELAFVRIVGDLRPVVVKNLTDGSQYIREVGTTKIEEDSEDPTRGVISGTWFIRTGSGSLPQAISQFETAVRVPGFDEFVEWKAPPSVYPVYMKRLGPGVTKLVTTSRRHVFHAHAKLEVAIPVELPPRGLSMDIQDDFQVDSLAIGTGGDYTFDAGASTIVCSGGELVPTTLALKQLYHTARGYAYGDVEVTMKVVLGASDASSAGLIITRLAPGDFLFARMDNLGENWAIGKMEGGVETLYAAPGYNFLAATTYWLRVRKEGNVLTGEVFTSEPGPMTAPAATAGPHTLVGVDAGQYGAGVVGVVGIRTTPGGLDERYDNFKVKPFTYRNQTLPKKISLNGGIPGEEKALVDFYITPSGGSDEPVWAGVALAPEPYQGTIEADDDDSGARVGLTPASGSLEVDPDPSDAGTAHAEWFVDLAFLKPKDKRAQSVDLDVFTSWTIHGSLQGFRATLSWKPHIGGTGPTHPSHFGVSGKSPVLPSSGAHRRFSYLGRLRIPRTVDDTAIIRVVLDLSWEDGSTGTVSIHSIFPWLADRFLKLPVGLELDEFYPQFVYTTGEVTRRMLADGRGEALSPADPKAIPDVGFGLPSVIEPTHSPSLLLKLSSQVPEDPVPNADDEQATHQATVHVRVTPRYCRWRGS